MRPNRSRIDTRWNLPDDGLRALLSNLRIAFKEDKWGDYKYRYYTPVNDPFTDQFIELSPGRISIEKVPVPQYSETEFLSMISN